MSDTPIKISTRGWHRWIPAILLFVPLLVHYPVVRNDFLKWDDNIHIADNPDFLPPTFDKVVHYWYEPYVGMYIPMTYSTWGVVATMAQTTNAHGDAQLRPLDFHTANLFLHAFTTLLVYIILLTLTKKPVPAALGALLFAVHPLQVEPIAWAMGMKDLLSAFFGLFALALYLDNAARAAAKRKSWVYIFATLLFLLALLAKPSTVVIPLMAIVLDRLILQRSWRIILVSLAPWFLLALADGIIARLAQPSSSIPPTSLAARPLIAADAVSFYLYKLFDPRHLGVDYGRTPAYVLAHKSLAALIAIPLLLLIFLAIVRKPIRPIIAVIALFIAALAPVLGLVCFDFQQFSTVADRYIYLAMLAPALAIAMLLTRFTSPINKITVILCLAICATISFRQTMVWKNTQTLFTHALDVNPNSWLSHTTLAALATDAGDKTQARQHSQVAVTLNDNFPLAHNAKGLALLPDLTQAIPEFRRACDLAPQNGDFQRNLAAAYANQGDLENAVKYFALAAQNKPQDLSIQQSLARAKYDLAQRQK